MEQLNEATQRKTLFEVIVNHEEQYTIHRKGKPVPAYWRLVGKAGDEKECLIHIKKVWTDMTPELAAIRYPGLRTSLATATDSVKPNVAFVIAG